jgi:hypothetical protein
MDKRGEEQHPDGSALTEVDLLKNKLEMMEEVVKSQAVEFRFELASTQANMQSDLKEHLDEFLATFIKMHSQTPPLLTKPHNSVWAATSLKI